MSATGTASATVRSTAPAAAPKASGSNEHPVSLGRIVVGVDGSEHSRRALRWAAYFARLTGSSVEATLVWEPPAPSGYGWNFTGTGYYPTPEMQKGLTDTLAAVYGDERPERLTLHTLQGYPAAQLIKRSKGAGLLIVGSRGHGGFAGMLLGSVSCKVAEHAHCPVLVVHENEPPGYEPPGPPAAEPATAEPAAAEPAAGPPAAGPPA